MMGATIGDSERSSVGMTEGLSLERKLPQDSRSGVAGVAIRCAKSGDLSLSRRRATHRG